MSDLEYTPDGTQLIYTQGGLPLCPRYPTSRRARPPSLAVSTPEGGWAIPRAVGIEPGRPAGLRGGGRQRRSTAYSGLAKYVAVLDT